jgi:RHS repeat-associated protein
MTYDALNRLTARTVPEAGYCARWEGIPTDDPSSGNQPPYPQYPSPNNTCVVPRQDTILYMPHFKTSGGYTVSGDTARFSYDEMGNTTIADNADARVRRSYYPNGQLHFDSLYIGTVSRDTVHKYIMEYLYDRDGRVQTLKHPVQLSGSASGYQTGMRYDPLNGALSTVINPLSSTYTYSYNERGQVSRISMPAGVSESYGYDQDGDVTRQLTASTTNVSFHDVTMSYDLRGRMTRLANAVAGKDTIDTNYSGLGQLHYQNQITHLKGNPIATLNVSTELFSNDAMGNRLGVNSQSTTSYQGGGFPGYTSNQRQSAYESGTGRLLVGQSPGSPNPYRDTTEYDEAGNIVFTTQIRPDVPDGLKVDRASFYGADGQLRAVDYRTTPALGDFQKDFEEYRYDALGRRVLVRARRSCYYNAACSWSYVRRTVWAGEQELYEIQMPDDSVTVVAGTPLRENDSAAVPHLPLTDQSDPNTFYGRVAYTYGLATDQPLGITRLGYADSAGTWTKPFTVVPLWTMRGYADTSYFAETGSTNCVGGRCVAVTYPAAYWMPAFRIGFISSAFHGSLMLDKADASGQLYRRNRYYDPATGRFTQEDPIGLAGGMNVYGFAGGDPVNFADPFGLCPPIEDCLQKMANWGAQTGGEVGSLALNGAAALNAVNDFNPITAAFAAGYDIGSGHTGRGLAMAALTVGGGSIGRGLTKGASAGLKALFAESGGLADETIIGIRAALKEDGFIMRLSENKKGYLFTNGSGEEVRLMRGDNGWYMRARNASRNYLDALGNPASDAATHLPINNR